MLRAQAHRGPDDEGLQCFSASSHGATVVLGNRRLAVLDPSPAGHQPMGNEDRSVWVAYNGELYNFPALRAELEARGWHFRSRSDTEVVLRAYEAFGEECVRRFRGMFALAIWDARQEQLLLARDRLGEKPLYMSWSGGRLLFASEVRALLASDLIDRELEPEALAGYLAFGAVPAPLSLVKSVRLLAPGSVVTWRRNELTERRYWACDFAPEPAMTEEEALEGLSERLRDAVRVRLLSDVPLGAFLSGGTDSSAVVALMRDAGVSHLRTFSLGFDEAGYDETPYARLVARQFETEHTEQIITSEEVGEGLDGALEAMDQPTVDGLNTYFVSRLTRASGTVVALSGLGGDELFGGYSTFQWVPRLLGISRALSLVPGARQGVAALLRAVPEGRSERLSAFLQQPPTAAGAYAAAKGLFVDGGVRRLLTRPGVDFDAAAYVAGSTFDEAEPMFNRVSRFELRTYLHHQLLRDADMMSMAHALELRPPLLDHLLVEFVGRIPPAFKTGAPKRMLLRAINGLVPSAVLKRGKWGFSFPLDIWMRGPWRADVERRLQEGSVGVFRREALLAVWHQFLAGRIRWSRVWALIVVQRWMERHLAAQANDLPAVETMASSA